MIKGILVLFAGMLFLSSCGSNEVRQEQSLSVVVSSEKEAYTHGVELAIDGRFEEAQDLFQKSLDRNDRYWPAEGSLRITNRVLTRQIAQKTAIHLFKGIRYGNQQDDQRKILEINEAIALDPKCALAYNERGVAYYKLGLLPQAISDRTRAIELEPTYAAPYYNKAVACETAGRLWEAVEAYKGFVQHAPPYFATHIDFARKRIIELTQEATGVKDMTPVKL